MLLALALALAALPEEDVPMVPEARADLVRAFHLLLDGLDDNGDGRLSPAEWSGAGRREPAADRRSPIRMALTAPPGDVFRELDSNHDEQLSFEEFTRLVLADFDCRDADHDGIVQPAENAAGRARCAAAREPQSPVRAPAAARNP